MAKIAHRPTPAKLTLPTFTSIPPELPPRTTVKLKIAEIDSEKRFIALSYLNAVV